MSIRVLIPTPLRPFTDQLAKVETAAGDVGAVLASLTSRFPALRHHLFHDEGRLRNFVNVYVNDDDIRHLDGLATPARDGDTISIVPSVAGGSGAALPELSREEVERYSRHLIVPEVGLEGQRKLKAARVLCVGAGGLGSPAALYLAAAGVGTIGLVDFDVVDVSNLQRQVLYSTDQVGLPKTSAAAARLSGLNPHLTVIRHDGPLTSANALEIVKDYDLVLDGADNFPTRYLVNDACVLAGKPNVYGSIFRFEGQVSVFATKGGPCYRCLYPEPPPPGLVPSCAEGGVLGVLPGLVGVAQATEAIKLILGIGASLAGRLLLIDALDMDFRTVRLRPDAGCPVCGASPTITTLIDYERFCGVTPKTTPDEWPSASVEQLRERLANGGVWLLDVREPSEFEICCIPGSTLIPLNQLEARLGEIPAGPGAPEIYVHCKMGGRSATAVARLRERGIPATNVTGGILAWIERIDPALAKY